MSASALSALTAFAVTMSLGYLMIVAAAAVAGAVTRGGRRERAVDAYEALAVSRFTIPVSVIVPLEDHHAPLSQSVAALLELNYPELEVIVVTDRIPDASSEAFKTAWSLEPKEVFYRRALPTAAVHRIYGSERDPRLTLVEKAAGGRADALNCGVSLARFRYVVSVSPEIVFDCDALLRLMSPALRDPGAVLAVTSYVERKRSGEAGPTDPRTYGPTDLRTYGPTDPRTYGPTDPRTYGPTDPRTHGPTDLRTHGPAEWSRAGDDYQRLSSIRSWMASRLAWHQLRCGVPPRDGVAAWRRDAVLEVGGFSVDAADAELDLLIRLQTLQKERAAGRVVRTSEVFGHINTLTVPLAADIAAKRQHALVEAFRTFARSRDAGAPRRTMMFVMAVELLTPVAQVFVLAAILAGTAFGWFGWRSPFYALLLLTFGYGLVSASALLLRGGTPGAPMGADLKRLLMRAPLEFLIYRPALVWSRVVNR